jgi:hypothetical protein
MGRLADGQAPHAILAHIKSHMFDEDQTRLLIFNHARKRCRHARLPIREKPARTETKPADAARP